jgi:hypothetical protein
VNKLFYPIILLSIIGCNFQSEGSLVEFAKEYRERDSNSELQRDWVETAEWRRRVNKRETNE